MNDIGSLTNHAPNVTVTRDFMFFLSHTACTPLPATTEKTPFEQISARKHKPDIDLSERKIPLSVFMIFSIFLYTIMYQEPLCDIKCKSGGQTVHASVTFDAYCGDIWCILRGRSVHRQTQKTGTTVGAVVPVGCFMNAVRSLFFLKAGVGQHAGEDDHAAEDLSCRRDLREEEHGDDRSQHRLRQLGGGYEGR